MTIIITKFLNTKLQYGSPSYFFQIQYSIVYAELNRFNSKVFYLQTNEGLVVHLIIKHLLIRPFTQEIGSQSQCHPSQCNKMVHRKYTYHWDEVTAGQF